MTRETKVGLLVGLGVILLIGIIVSDHLSDSKRQSIDSQFTQFANSAQNSVAAPLNTNTHTNQPSTTAPDPRRPLSPQATIPMPSEIRQRSDQARNLADNAVLIPTENESKPVPIPTKRVDPPTALNAQPNTFVPHTPASQPQPRATTTLAPRKVTHRVKPNESLWEIAQQYYKDGSKWKLIRDANPRKVRENGQVRVGVDLIIPEATSNVKPVIKTSTRPKTTAASPKYITVKKGDTLHTLAQKHFGSGKNWRQLYNLNRSVIGSNPNALKPGMKLKIRP